MSWRLLLGLLEHQVAQKNPSEDSHHHDQYTASGFLNSRDEVKAYERVAVWR